MQNHQYSPAPIRWDIITSDLTKKRPVEYVKITVGFFICIGFLVHIILWRDVWDIFFQAPALCLALLFIFWQVLRLATYRRIVYYYDLLQSILLLFVLLVIIAEEMVRHGFFSFVHQLVLGLEGILAFCTVLSICYAIYVYASFQFSKDPLPVSSGD